MGHGPAVYTMQRSLAAGQVRLGFEHPAKNFSLAWFGFLLAFVTVQTKLNQLQKSVE